MHQHALYRSSVAATDPTSGFSETEESILLTLAYFDIFHYPLTRGEIEKFRQDKGDEKMLSRTLEELLSKKLVFRLGDLYALQDNHLLSFRRKDGNKRASQMLGAAKRNGRFLQRFPFVRAVGISGSLSKDYAEVKADYDFFIITKANRLWIARTIMHLFKKFTFLTGRQHFYCMNYFLDEQALSLEDRNIFTAVELKTLLPVSGETFMKQLFNANQWANELLPACPFREQEKKDGKRSLFKSAIEWIFDNKLGDRIDDYLFRLTNRRWKKKEEKGKKNSKGVVMMLLTGKHFAKSNPGALQEKVLELYDKKIKKLNSSWSYKSNGSNRS